MRELTDVIWYGAFDTYRDLEETIDKALEAHGISLAEWTQFQNRRDVERSVEKAGTDGILLKDLADYHGLQQQDLMKQLSVMGAAMGEDGRFCLPSERVRRSEANQDYLKEHLRSIGAMMDDDGRFRRPGELASFKRLPVSDVRGNLQKLLRDAGPAGLSLDELSKQLDCHRGELLEHLEKKGVAKGEDGRFRWPPSFSVACQKLLRDAGPAGLSLKELSKHLGYPRRKVLEQLEKRGVVNGEDGRFRWLPAYAVPGSAWQTQVELERADSDHRRLAFAAMAAFYRKDHRTVVKALTAVRDGLTASEQARLAYACKRLGSKRAGRSRV